MTDKEFKSYLESNFSNKDIYFLVGMDIGLERNKQRTRSSIKKLKKIFKEKPYF